MGSRERRTTEETMSAQQILVLGGGFAGLWSALGAARKLDELGRGPEAVEVTLVNRDAFHDIRVRNYEADLSSVRVPLDDVLGPVGVRRVEAEVTGIDSAGQIVTVSTPIGQQRLPYDRLVFALGSQLFRPNIPGLHEYGLDVDTYNGAARLNSHLHSLPEQPESAGRFTVVVVGAGLTGIEAATEMPGKLRAVQARANLTRSFRVILADHVSTSARTWEIPRSRSSRKRWPPSGSRHGWGSKSSRSALTGSHSRPASEFPRPRWSGAPGCGPTR